MDVGNTDFEVHLGSVLSLSPSESPTFECGGDELFKDLVDFVDNPMPGMGPNCNQQAEGNNSPEMASFYSLSSDSEQSVIDVENSNDGCFQINMDENSVADNELVQYLTAKNNEGNADGMKISPVVYNKEKDPQTTVKVIKHPVVSGRSGVFESISEDSKPVAKRPLIVHGSQGVFEIQNSTSDCNKVVNGKLQVIRTVPHPAKIIKRQSPEDIENVKGQCLSKSAVAARENRQKKKKYIQELESNFTNMKEENDCLRSQVDNLEAEVKSLNSEVAYLKNVLANQSTLSKLLKNIPNISGVRLRTSENQVHVPGNVQGDVKSCVKKSPYVSSLKRRNEEDHMYASYNSNRVVGGSFSGSSKKLCTLSSKNLGGGGVCLHVEQGDVSLEFCAECSEKATKARLTQFT